MPEPLLELEGISKRFPGVVALDDVSMAVQEGEVVGLIGENGAGKSTLMKIAGGVLRADSGAIRMEGLPVAIRAVAGATALGISFVHQELNVLDNLDVSANLFLGREPTWGGPLRLIDRRRIEAESEHYLRRLGLRISPRAPLRDLSLAQQQMVEIARALSQNARLLILDEPTSALTLAETDRLLATVGELRSQGVSVIYISHRLAEIQRCADRVVALRDGRNAGELARSEIDHERMVRLMVGRDLQDLYVEGSGARTAPRLQVRGLRTAARPRHAISFEIRGGEILGFAGLAGAGRSETAQAIFGVDAMLEGEILLDGEPIFVRSPRDAIDAGIFLVPEDRRRTGVITEMMVRENITLPALRRYSTLSLVDADRETTVARQQVQALGIRTPTVETKVASLSGGNQQKVVLSKWLALAPKVLILDEPTRGIDIGAKAEIYRLMRELADRGVAILMISSDMEEVLGISDRLAVMHEGAIAGILPREEFSEETVMNLCVGRRERPAAA
jgi:ribose transport system ATP-binding protein